MRRFLALVLMSTIGLILTHTVDAQTGDDSSWRPWTANQVQRKTDDELRAEGRARAEAEYRNGWAEIESFGLWMGSVYVDEETGLYRRPRGCAILNRADIESEAYNERIKEFLAIHGLPHKARGIRERFRRLRKFMERKPVLAWVSVPWSEVGAKSGPTRIGPFEIVAKLVPNLPNPACARVRIEQGNHIVATVSVEEGRAVAVALVPALEVLIIKEPGSVDTLTFIDARHGRVMWRYPGPMDMIRNRLDEKSQSDPASSAT